MIDCHVHAYGVTNGPQKLEEIRRYVGAERMNVVCTFRPEWVNTNPAAFVTKALYPGKFFIFPALDHANYFSDGSLSPPPLSEQVDRLKAIGADGIKMLENKPTHRKLLDIPVDSLYFEDYFSRVEETGITILWHVADPEEFWDPMRTPKWAKERGWGYDKTFVDKEQLYAEVENVLIRHPKLKIVFAHFYFLSADLPRLALLFERFEGVHVDLAPGIEMLYNISKDVSAGKDFFTKYADRILFGTDISNEQTLDESGIRAGIVTRWLETDDEFRVPEEADFLLGAPEDGVIRGLALPRDVLQKIYADNFVRLVGESPCPLNPGLAAEECIRLAHEVSSMTGRRTDEVEASRAVKILAQGIPE